MTFHPGLASRINDTRTRSRSISPQSGMCSFCAADAPGTCEIGLSAVLGAQSVYPTTTGDNQIASEKDYPLDYSHFNINGRVFGAQGAPALADEAAIFNVKLERTLGRRNPVKIALPAAPARAVENELAGLLCRGRHGRRVLRHRRRLAKQGSGPAHARGKNRLLPLPRDYS